jgi:hypothetical protein
MARWQHHLRHVPGVPGTENESAVVRVRAQFVDYVSELVYTLSSIVCLGIDILGTEMTPLEAVDRA